MCFCVQMIYITYLGRLLTFVKTLEVVLRTGKKYTSVYLETQTLVPEASVILYFEMLRTFCRPMSVINSKFGGYAFGIFLLFRD